MSDTSNANNANREKLKERFRQKSSDEQQRTLDDENRKKIFEAFHQGVLDDVLKWIADLPNVSASKPEEITIPGGESLRIQLKGFSVELRHPGLFPLHIEGKAFNRIEFHDAKKRATLILTTRGKDVPEHDFTVETSAVDSKDPFHRGRKATKRFGLWSEDTFATLMDAWLNEGEKR